MCVSTHRPHESVRSIAFRVQPGPSAGDAPGLLQFQELVQKRLDMARLGLTELRRRLDAGQEEDAAIIRSKIDEDLSMLQRRLNCEVEKATTRSAPVRRDEVRAEPR
jgi:hypothetical protein